MSRAQHDTMIADSAKTFLERIGGVGRARRLHDAGTTFDADAWQEVGRLGWCALLVPEEAGGLGLGGRDLCDLMEVLGAQLAREPVAEVIAAGAAIAAADASSSLLRGLAEGSAIVIPVAGGNFQLSGNRLVGAAKPVAHLASATHALTQTRDGGIYVVPLSATGATLTTHIAVDGSSFSRLQLDTPVAEAEELRSARGQQPLDAASALVQLAYAAYLAGLADAAFSIALAYLKTRKQFGVAIGSFQALQHRAATLYVRIASLRALLDEVASSTARKSFPAGAAAAALLATETALQVTKECIQFHGAIGFADEHPIGLFLKRAMSVAAALGTADECLDQYLRHARSDCSPA